MNGRPTWALLDTRCERTLVRKAQGPETGAQLTLNCIHGDIEDWPTKIVSLELDNVKFFYTAGVVAQLRHPFLIGQHCHIFEKLVSKSKGGHSARPKAHMVMSTDDPGISVPVSPGELAQLTHTDATLKHPWQGANQVTHPGYTRSQLVWKGPLLYRR